MGNGLTTKGEEQGFSNELPGKPPATKAFAG